MNCSEVAIRAVQFFLLMLLAAISQIGYLAVESCLYLIFILYLLIHTTCTFYITKKCGNIFISIHRQMLYTVFSFSDVRYTSLHACGEGFE